MEDGAAVAAAARESASSGARVVLALSSQRDCRHALRGPLGLLQGQVELLDDDEMCWIPMKSRQLSTPLVIRSIYKGLLAVVR